MTTDDLAAHARALIDSNLYLTLGTLDADGNPWTPRRQKPPANPTIHNGRGRVDEVAVDR